VSEPARSGQRVVTILGPQRRPTLDQVTRTLDADARIAVVTAGWQERETDDEELRSILAGRAVNLELHSRWLDVLERDREFAQAESEHRAVLDELQQLYLVQLDHALRAMYGVAQRAGARPRATRAALDDAMAVVRLVDERHVVRVAAAHREFYAAWRPQERPVVAPHRESVRALLESASGLVVAGGHVGVLVRVLHLFHIAPFLPERVVAWSAGAMALTERVVLFNDRAPQGPAHAEIYDEGLGLIAEVVFLPHARRRLNIDDLTRMSVLATRLAPALCVVLDDGTRVDLSADGHLPPGARVIGPDGRIRALEAA
jgi:hypothetical protein